MHSESEQEDEVADDAEENEDTTDAASARSVVQQFTQNLTTAHASGDKKKHTRASTKKRIEARLDISADDCFFSGCLLDYQTVCTTNATTTMTGRLVITRWVQRLCICAIIAALYLKRTFSRRAKLGRANQNTSQRKKNAETAAAAAAAAAGFQTKTIPRTLAATTTTTPATTTTPEKTMLSRQGPVCHNLEKKEGLHLSHSRLRRRRRRRRRRRPTRGSGTRVRR